MVGWKILFPIHILWINLVTDTLPALALGLEKAESDIMKQAPRKSSESVFADRVGIGIIYQGILEAAITLFAYWWGHTHYAEDIAVTMAFATLGLIQLTHAFNVRSNHQSLFAIGPFSNKYLNGAAVLSGLLVILVILLPFMNDLFRVVPLNGKQWLIVAISALIIIPLVEIVKLISRSKHRRA
jgi:Ca2+-transporting ATPase